MENSNITLIGSACIPVGLRIASISKGSVAPRINALASDKHVAAEGIRLLHGSFLDAGKIATIVHGSGLVIYAPRAWRAWIPAYFERGLRYTLLGAGWAGSRSLIVVPPERPRGSMLRRALEPLRRRIVDRAEQILRRQCIEWRVATEHEEACPHNQGDDGSAFSCPRKAFATA